MVEKEPVYTNFVWSIQSDSDAITLTRNGVASFNPSGTGDKCLVMVFDDVSKKTATISVLVNRGDDANKLKRSFVDVDKSDRNYDSIMNVVSRGLMVGVSEDEFDPDGTSTRAMIITVLGREEGANVEGFENIFDDVQDDAYYAGYAGWGYQKNYINGVGEGKYDPDKNVTYQELYVMKYNQLKAQGLITQEMLDSFEFNGADNVADWAKDPTKAMAMIGATITDENGNVMASEDLPRGDMAAIIDKTYDFETVKDNSNKA